MCQGFDFVYASGKLAFNDKFENKFSAQQRFVSMYSNAFAITECPTICIIRLFLDYINSLTFLLLSTELPIQIF